LSAQKELNMKVNGTILVVTALAWTFVSPAAFAQEHGKNAGVRKHHAHHRTHGPGTAAHAKAMDAGKASIASHPSAKKMKAM
jgi:hypothetical protein